MYTHKLNIKILFNISKMLMVFVFIGGQCNDLAYNNIYKNNVELDGVDWNAHIVTY